MASFFILQFYLGKASTKSQEKMTFGKTLGWSLSISMRMQTFIEIFQKVQEIGPVLLLSEFGSWQSLDRWQMTFDNPFG